MHALALYMVAVLVSSYEVHFSERAYGVVSQGGGRVDPAVAKSCTMQSTSRIAVQLSCTA